MTPTTPTTPALAAFSLTLTLAVTAVAGGLGGTTEVLSLDPALGQFPEGVAVNKKGEIFVSVAPTGDLLRIAKGGEVTTHASLDVGAGFLLGMTVDAAGAVYVALASFDPSTEGVYKVSPGGDVDLVANIAGFPNDLVLDPKAGVLYVTESIGGAVHRITLSSGESALWFEDPLLQGDLEVSPVPFPIGANGIARDKGTLIVANSQQPRLVRIPIDGAGDPGDPLVILDDPILAGADGIALDVHRAIYVACNEQDLLLRVSADGESVEVIADASDGLDFPATVAFGQGPAGKKSLYVTNFALFTGESAAPGLLRVNVALPGLKI